MTRPPAPRSSFFVAAERLDAVVREVKARQRNALGFGAAPADEPAALHPEEAWARRFGMQSIRPVSAAERPPLSRFVAPSAEVPKMPDFTDPPVGPAPDWKASRGHIGSSLGKGGPRRWWISRLFGGRGI